MIARTAMARVWEMSSWATSAAHDSRNAAPMIAAPKRMVSTSTGMSGLAKWTMTPGRVAAKARTRGRQATVRCAMSCTERKHTRPA